MFLHTRARFDGAHGYERTAQVDLSNQPSFTMNTTSAAHLVALIGAVASFAGATQLTSADISGFLNVLGAIVAIFGVVVAHFAHKSEIAAS